MDWHDRIVCNPDILVGKPTVKGTRLSVELILGWLAQGWSHQRILDEYPQLQPADLQAVFAFVRDGLKDEAMRLQQARRRARPAGRPQNADSKPEPAP